MRNSAAILLVSLLLLDSCSSANKLLCRAWKVDNIDFEPPKNDFEAKIQKALQAEVPNLGFTFKADSTFVGGKKDQPNAGKWWFTKKKKGIVLVTAKEQTNGKIITLSKTQLVMENTGPHGNKITFIMSPAPATK